MYHVRALEGYMKIVMKKWTTHDVGTKVEAFAIAGCDALSKCVSLCLPEIDSCINRSCNDI